MPSDALTSKAIDKLVKKIDGVWIKISSDDLKQYSEEYSVTQKCFNDTINKFKNDKESNSEITELYRNNQFIIIDKELGQKDGSFGYEMTNNNTVLKKFIIGLIDTKIYKALHDCDKSFIIKPNDIKIDELVINNDSNAKVELWIDVWSHQITKMYASGKDGTTTITTTILPKFNETVSIKAPESSISLTELMTSVGELFEAFSEDTGMDTSGFIEQS